MKSQGARIGLLRDSLKWSNLKLSERTGIPAPTLSMYIYAKKLSINSHHLWRIAQATGVTTDWLISGDRRGLSKAMLDLLGPEPNNDSD